MTTEPDDDATIHSMIPQLHSFENQQYDCHKG
jgi:hypothetical protein